MGILYEKLIALEDLAFREGEIKIKLCEGKDEAEIYVENCKKVLSCDNEFITLEVCGANVRVCGSPLVFENFGAGGLKITGKLSSIDFSNNFSNNFSDNFSDNHGMGGAK